MTNKRNGMCVGICTVKTVIHCKDGRTTFNTPIGIMMPYGTKELVNEIKKKCIEAVAEAENESLHLNNAIKVRRTASMRKMPVMGFLNLMKNDK